MLIVHEVSTQAGTAIGNSAIGNQDIQSAQGGRDMYDKKAMKEANGGIPSKVSKNIRRETLPPT
jgi:hypothetical protein